MTYIFFDGHVFSVKGHAGYAKKGQDIVCSSLSSYCNAFLMLAELLKKQGEIAEYRVTFKEADIEVLIEGASDFAKKIFSGIYGLMEALAQQFPSFVTREETGDRG